MTGDAEPTKRDVETVAYSPVSRFICRGTVLLYIKLFHRFRVTGLEKIPKTGAFIFAPNHASYLDPMAVTCGNQRVIHYLAGARLFKNRFFAALIRSLGAYPVNLGRDADRAAYEAALRLLRAGEAVCLYPEGTRSADGRLLPLKGGVGRLAVATGAPIFPAVIRGNHHAWPRGKMFPTFFRPLSMEILDPLVPQEAATGGERRAEGARLMGELERRLKAGLGEPPPEADSPSTPAPAAD